MAKLQELQEITGGGATPGLIIPRIKAEIS